MRKWIGLTRMGGLAAAGVLVTSCFLSSGGGHTGLTSGDDGAAPPDLISPGPVMDLYGVPPGTGADLWQRLATAEPTQSIVVRLSTLPSCLAALWARASLAAERAGGYAHATMSRGVVRCVFPAPVDPAGESRLRQTMVELVTGCSAVGERLPASMWNVLARARETDALMSGVRRAFDPDGIVNAGILGDIA